MGYNKNGSIREILFFETAMFRYPGRIDIPYGRGYPLN